MKTCAFLRHDNVPLSLSIRIRSLVIIAYYCVCILFKTTPVLFTITYSRTSNSRDPPANKCECVTQEKKKTPETRNTKTFKLNATRTRNTETVEKTHSPKSNSVWEKNKWIRNENETQKYTKRCHVRKKCHTRLGRRREETWTRDGMTLPERWTWTGGCRWERVRRPDGSGIGLRYQHNTRAPPLPPPSRPPGGDKFRASSTLRPPSRYTTATTPT